ncbi:hypothetical protein EYF80_011870 [Liparis tanakae]|uniref:Uncharacterized protein n=1 Tax=Liparis tanakae TaxID=230148 RepID=A0A4Z2IJH8_9TELE|nr:hypothetical protein EYF80_011870 [Liparis tanakae]
MFSWPVLWGSSRSRAWASIHRPVAGTLTPSVSVSSLVTASPADSSVVFSSDGVAPSAVNLQSSERLDRVRGTFRGFLNVTSTMIGSVGTERWPYTKQVTLWKKKIVTPDWLASVGMSEHQVRSKGRGSRGALTLGHSQWEAQVVCLAVQAALGGLESCWDNPPVGCSHQLFLQVAPHDCQVLVILLVQRHMSGCLLFTCRHQRYSLRKAPCCVAVCLLSLVRICLKAVTAFSGWLSVKD